METLKSDGIWAKSVASARMYEDSREAFFRILDQGIMPESFTIKSSAGNYGNLEVYENGKWGVYTPDPAKISSIALNQEEYDVFEYSYMDEEGNLNGGEVRIEVNYGGSNRVYSTEDPIYFDEKYLSRGTEPDWAENVKTGKIYFTEDEHLEYIVISDYGMSRMAFLDMDGTQSSIYYSGGLYPYEDGQRHNYFSFEAWKSGPGELSYIARLWDATYSNSTLINGDSHTNVDVRCDFRYSDRANDYRYIPIHIKDDVAYIKDIPICELGAPAPGIAFAYGNVADYVVKGADARAITTPWGGELPEITSWWIEPDLSQEAFAPYGTLTLSEDGTYYFDFNPQSEAFRTIHEGEIVSLNLPFQYKECDGEPIQGSIQINLMGTNLSLTPLPGNVPTSGGDVPADNPYVPGNPDDPDRDPTVFDPSAEAYDPMNPNWGLATDGQPLLRVFESGLPTGSEAGQRNVTAHGYLDIDATVGLQSLVATTDGADSYGFEDNTMAVPLDGGTLTFTKDPDENHLKYEFALADPVTHDPGNGINSAMQNVKLVATDNFGNEERIALDVQIIDDVPKLLVSDASHELGANAIASVTGDINNYIIKGVDPGAADNWWTDPDALKAAFAPYGALTMGSDGTYSFALDPQSEAFRAIPASGTVNLELPFQYKDLDGDSVQGSVQFNLTGTEISLTPRPGNVPTSGGDVTAGNPYVPGNPADPDRDLSSSGAGDYDPMNPNWGLAKDGQPLLRVFESGLPNGSEAGQRNVTAHGYLDIKATVGLQSLVATTDGADSYGFEGDTMAVPLDGGTLTFTKNDAENWLKYEFTLTDPVMHDPGNGINSAMQNVKLIATDNFGNEERIGLGVQIIDDVPRDFIHDYVTRSLPAWYFDRYIWNTQNMFLLSADFNQGTDSFSVTHRTGNYGIFGWNAESVEFQFVYEIDHEKIASLNLSAGETITDATTVTYTDADGDSAEMNINILLEGPGIKPRFTADEADIFNGAIVEIYGFEILDVVTQGQYGTVSKGEDGLWQYMLRSGINSGSIQGANTIIDADTFTLKIKEKGYDGEQLVPFNVDIIDSVPTFTAAQDSLVYDFGADNGEGASLSVQVEGMTQSLVPGVETMISGRNGLLTLSADGSCLYAPNFDYAGEDIFDFTITDSDGDRALATVIASVVDGLPQTAISVQTADELAAIEALGVPDGDSGGFIGA